MATERTLELDQPVLTDETANALREATDRAERAEAELAKLRAHMPKEAADRGTNHANTPTHSAAAVSSARASHAGSPGAASDTGRVQSTPDDQAVYSEDLKQPPSPNTAANAPDGYSSSSARVERGSANRAMAEHDGVDEVRKDPMMAHLLAALDAGTDVGHYGRLVFAMVARHFLPHEEVIAWLTKDSDFSVDEAQQMLHQVEGRDYSPPRRERLLEWQREQDFQFIDPADPDSGNLYRNLTFPQEIYQHIGHYQEAKAHTS